MKRNALAVLCAGLISSLSFAQVYSNGPMITHPTGGFGGAPASALNNGTPDFLTTYGFGVQGTALRLADDFTVPCGESWTINTIKVFAFPTYTVAPFPTASNLLTANYRIWSGRPGVVGSTILFDFSATNQMTATNFTGIYKVLISALTGTDKPIHEAIMQGNSITLPQGTYWLDYRITSSAINGSTNVFSSPITILNQPVTGNGIQFNAAWGNVLSSNGFEQGLPFEIDHTTTPTGAPCWSFNITQVGGPGQPIQLSDTGGIAGNTFINVITLAQGSYPNGWLFGLDVSVPELTNLLNSGPPFVGTLDFAGNFILPPIGPGGLPGPINVYYVGLQLNGTTLVAADSPKTVVLAP